MSGHGWCSCSTTARPIPGDAVGGDIGDGAPGLRGGAAGCTSAQVVSQFTSHLLEQPRELRPDAQVVVMTAHGTMETAIQAMQQGAYDYLAKPFDLDEACSSPSAR